MPQYAAVIDLSTLDGTNGFRLDGIDTFDQSGFAVASAGDVNSDGFGDVIIGAPFGSPGGDTYAGESYVVFGKASGFAASLDLSILDGTNGFRLDGIDAGDLSGWSVASAGDFNGDGFGDLIIGARSANPDGPVVGESYLVFGIASGFAATLNLSALDGSTGFALNDLLSGGGYVGNSVSSGGDVNGDGLDDLMIASPLAGANGVGGAGKTYIVFGSTSGFAANFALSSLNGADGFVINGIDTNDQSGNTNSR